eukprot:4931114-Karenia_brevis.AAC.1
MGEDISNNVAEHQGLLQCLAHAAERPSERICIQTDSLLVAQQVNFKWACRCSTLRPLLLTAWHLIR